MLCRRTMPHSAVLARREARVEGGGHPWLRSGAPRACRSDPSGRDDGSVPRRDGPHRQPTCQAAHGRLLRVRSGPLGDTSATGAVLGAMGRTRASGPRTDRSPTTSSNPPPNTPAPSRGHRGSSDTRSMTAAWIPTQDSCHGSRTEIGRGMGIGVTERDNDEDTERDEGVISPGDRSQHDSGPNLHQRCRTRGVSSPGASTYTHSHT